MTQSNPASMRKFAHMITEIYKGIRVCTCKRKNISNNPPKQQKSNVIPVGGPLYELHREAIITLAKYTPLLYDASPLTHFLRIES